MIVSIIVAVGENGVIGDAGQLPWHLPDDLKRFRAITWGKPIIMGRKTFESIGRPLPGRTNIVLTHSPEYCPDGCLVASTPADALAAAAATGADEAVVIGGSAIYREFLPRCDRIYLTTVEGAFQGDTFFPEPVWNSADWEVTHEECRPADAKNPYGTRYRILSRPRSSASGVPDDRSRGRAAESAS